MKFDIGQFLDLDLEKRIIRETLSSEKVLKQCIGELSYEDFATRETGNAFRAISSYYDEFKALPGPVELETFIDDFYGNQPGTPAVIKELLNRTIWNLKPLQDEHFQTNTVEKYVRSVKRGKALYNAGRELLDKEGKDSDKIFAELHSNLKALENSKGKLTVEKGETMIDGALDFSTFFDKVSPTGVNTLDHIQGVGLNRKELFLLLAPTNVGKSWACVHFANHARQRGMNVLFLTLEMSEKNVHRRMLSNLTFHYVPRNENDFEKEIVDWSECYSQTEKGKGRSLLYTEEVREKLSSLEKFKWGGYAIQEFSSNTCSSFDVENCVESFKDTFGEYPDLVIVDGLMNMKLKSEREPRFALLETATELRRIAGEYDCCVLTTTQGNRESLKAKSVGLEHTAESFGVTTVADIIISLQRSNDDMKRIITLNKNRNGPVGHSIEVYQNLDRGQFCAFSTFGNYIGVETQPTPEPEEENSTDDVLLSHREKRRVSFRD